MQMFKLLFICHTTSPSQGLQDFCAAVDLSQNQTLINYQFGISNVSTKVQAQSYREQLKQVLSGG